jgi:hypothetical protein
MNSSFILFSLLKIRAEYSNTQLGPCTKQHEECTIYPEEDEELGRTTELASGDQ